jgi:hypothetical protein
MPFHSSLDNIRWYPEVDSEATRDEEYHEDDMSAFDDVYGVELFTDETADHVNLNLYLPPDASPNPRYDTEFQVLSGLIINGYDLVETLAGFVDLIQPSNIERMSPARAERATRLRNEALRLTNIFGVWS